MSRWYGCLCSVVELESCCALLTVFLYLHSSLSSVNSLWAVSAQFQDQWSGRTHGLTPWGREKGKKGKGRKMGLKTKQRQQSEEEQFTK